MESGLSIRVPRFSDTGADTMSNFGEMNLSMRLQAGSAGHNQLGVELCNALSLMSAYLSFEVRQRKVKN